MNVQRIQSILEASSSKIKAAHSFSEKLKIVYDILDKSFPKVTQAAALCGPVTNLADYMARTNIELLLKTIKKSSENGTEYVTMDKETNIVLKTIYELVKS